MGKIGMSETYFLFLMSAFLPERLRQFYLYSIDKYKNLLLIGQSYKGEKGINVKCEM